MSRATWVIAGLGLVVVALLMLWMGKTLDTKAPIRIERPEAVALPAVPTPSREQTAAEEEAAMRAAVARSASRYAARAAAQVFASDEAGRTECSFTGSKPLHRDGDTAWWNAEFSCVDRQAPAALPNLTSVSVRLRKAGGVWLPEE